MFSCRLDYQLYAAENVQIPVKWTTGDAVSCVWWTVWVSGVVATSAFSLTMITSLVLPVSLQKNQFSSVL